MIRQFLKCEITCSITQRILLTSALNCFCQFAEPVLRVERQQHAGFAQAVIIVTGSVDGVGNPGELAVNRACELDVHSGGLVLSRVEFWLRGP